jgi:hypothetical protein
MNLSQYFLPSLPFGSGGFIKPLDPENQVFMKGIAYLRARLEPPQLAMPFFFAGRETCFAQLTGSSPSC